MSRDISACMVTVDRSPQPNYLRQTLGNLVRSDLLTSERLSCLFLSDSGPDSSMEWACEQVHDAGLDNVVPIGSFRERQAASLNVANALRVAAGMEAHWVLFLEDDIDVIDGFFDAVGAWLDEHADPDRYPVYTFGTPYPQVSAAAERGESQWRYPVGSFYGTQALGVPAAVAAEVATYLEAHCRDRCEDGTGYDLLMGDWARSAGHDFFLASCPSFVEHTGRESVIRPRPKTHRFASWPGPGWSYEGRSTPREKGPA